MADQSIEDRTGLRYVVSATEIAELVGASTASTVSNWRARHPDFPMPVMRGHNAPFELDDVLAWIRRADTPAHLKESLNAEWWWGKTVDAVRAVVDLPRTTGTVSPLRNYLSALVLLRAALVGDVRGVRGSARRWTALVTASDPDVALEEEAHRLEDGHAVVRRLLVDPLRGLRIPPSALSEVLRRLEAAGVAGVPSRRLLEVVLEHVSSAVHPRQVVTTTGEELAATVADLAGAAAGDVLYDPCVGEGGLLVACARAAGGEITAFAQELDVDASRIARTRFLLEPVSVEVGEPGLDTLSEDQFPGRRADIAVADPPVVARASLVSWVDHLLDHLVDGGRAVIAIPAYAVARLDESRRKPDSDLRDKLGGLAEDGQVASVVMLPHDVRRDVPGPITVWRLEADAVEGRDVEFQSKLRRGDDEDREDAPISLPAHTLLETIESTARQFTSGRGRPPSRFSSGRGRKPGPPAPSRSDMWATVTSLSDELAPLLDTLSTDDPDKAERVRLALGELQSSLEPAE